MTPSMLLRVAARIMAGMALGASGIYVIVYLWRWEWNRALITGMLFLATLIVISTWAILGAVHRLGVRLDRLEDQATASTQVARTLRRASAEHATRHFDWLREPPDRLSVFVPILLGAGAILSGIAYLIERLAGAVGGPAVDRQTAQLLAYDLPLGAPTTTGTPGAVPQMAGSGPDRAGPAPRPRRAPGRSTPRRRGARTAIAGVGLAVVMAGSVWVLREATQTRPDPRSSAGRTEIVLDISQRATRRDPVDVAAALWTVCRNRVARDVELTAVQPGDRPDRPVLLLDRTLGRHARERLTGCLQDTVLDRVQADVLQLTSSPGG